MQLQKPELAFKSLILWTVVCHGSSLVHYASPGDGPTAFCDCIKALTHPGAECRLRTGRYEVGAERCDVTGLHGTRDQPIVISSAGDGPVVVDGTLPIDGPWSSSGGFFTAPIGDHKFTQLFIDGHMQVLARFPNALWSDKSVFFAVANWLRSEEPGIHNLSSGVGLLRDQGPCQPGDVPGTCNTHGLATSGINATGALGVLNLYSCDTGVQSITRHDAATPGVLHYNATWHGLCDTYRGGFGRYFLQGKSAGFLDHQEEWVLDLEQQLIKRTAPPPPGAEVRGRVSDFALAVNGASWLAISNLSFHATTLSVTGNVSNVSLSSLVFNYSAVSRRSLGEDTPPIGLTVWRQEQEDEQEEEEDARKHRQTAADILIDDVVVRYSDGPALMLSGGRYVRTLRIWEITVLP